MATKLNYRTLWMNYYDYELYPDSKRVKSRIGGNVDATWIKNTCAIRLSGALNYSGAPLPRVFRGLKTVKGGDGKRYAFRIREMEPWLRHTLGKPQFEHKKKAGAAFDKTSLSAMKGIIGFDIRFSDATGHLDLWSGTKFSNEGKMSKNAWNASTRIFLWEAS